MKPNTVSAQMERDPRADPQAGDVMEIDGKRIEIIERSHRKVIYRYRDQYTLGAGLGRFRIEHSTATIIKRGDPPSQPSQDNGHD